MENVRAGCFAHCDINPAMELLSVPPLRKQPTCDVSIPERFTETAERMAFSVAAVALSPFAAAAGVRLNLGS